MSPDAITLERAAAALRQARRRIEELERAAREPIAVVSMACRFPGAEDVGAFWELLRRGGDAIGDVPASRWSLDDYHDPDPAAPGRMYTKRGGFLPDVLGFDPGFFGMSDAEAEALDPQQRLLLEVSSEALDLAAGAAPEGSNTGVFVGICTHDAAQHSIRDEASDRIGVYTGTGNAFSTAAGRLAYTFGLRGPTLALDTACSSVLVATHLAVRSLRAGDCDAALVAGVNVMLAPAMTVYFCRLGVLAPDGVCRAFDADARGYARGEGCGALVLRRLADARQAGDPILGVIRGSAVNHNGRSNGLTAPSPRAQVELLRRALRDAGVAPEELGYLEAFGSGTPLGDAVELRALGEVLGPGGALPIGSVKTNIGHTEGAAGAASLIKALLSLQHRELAPSLHLARPSAALRAAPVRVVQQREPWPEGRPLLAGVSGFGFGGTNAHVVLEAAPPASEPARAGPLPVVLSARSEAALAVRVRRLREHLAAHPSQSLDAVSRGACAGVRHHEHRLALSVGSLAELDEALAAGRYRTGRAGESATELAASASPCERFSAGADVDWAAVCGPGPRAALPPHPFERRPFPVPRVTTARAAPPSPRADPLAGAAPARRRELVEAALRRHLAALLGRAPESLSAGAALVELGLDSLGVVEAVQRLQRELGITVYADELLGADSLGALADRLARQAGRGAGGGGDPRPAPEAARIEARAHLAARFPVATSAARSPKLHPSPVLLLSAPRAGSTLLRAMLAGHPLLFAPPELHLLLHADMQAWDAALRPSMLHLGLAQALLHAGLDEAAAQRRVEAWRAEATPVAEVYAWLQARVGPRALVDKSPSYALDPAALARAEALFEAPRYVLLHRHPYAVIESFARKRMGRLFGAAELDGHLLGEAVWERAEAQMAALAGRCAGRAHHVVYEDLVRAPEATLRALLDFLGVPFDAAVLSPYAGDRMLGARSGAGGAIAFIGDPDFGSHADVAAELGERWKDARLPWLLGDEAVARAAALGYAIPAEARGEPAGDDGARLAADAAVPSGFPAIARAAAAPDGEIVLTGATGFLGVHLAAELLRGTSRPLRCIVRAPDAAAAAERVRAALVDWQLWEPAFADRIVGEPGDLAALAPARLAELACRTAAVYHNGAVVSFYLPYGALRGPNVDGTTAMLALAARAGAPFHHVSTKGVFTAGAYPGDDAILEDAAVRPVQGFALGYQRSKWVAEQRVAAVRARGLAAAVYRSGRIGGHSRTGRLPLDDFFARLVCGCVALGALPDVALPLEMLPVDLMAREIVRLSLDPRALGRVFHLVHDAPLDAAEVQAALAASGVALPLWAWPRWRAALLAQPGNALAPLSSLFTAELPERVHERRLRADNTRALLPGWSPPGVAEQLARNVAYLASAGALSAR